MERGTILVVDDEPNIADLVELYLRRDGYRVVKAATGEEVAPAVATHRPRLVVLDVGLPDIDGLEVCRRLRQTSAIPVIFLTARDTEIDRVLGLELGADDYVTKPFSPPELVARVKAVLRRAEGAATDRRARPGRRASTIDLGRREVRVDETPVAFTAQGIRPVEVPRRTARARARRASRSSTASGATTGTATPAPSTCTSRRCARSSTPRCASTRCAASGTGSTRSDRREPVKRARDLAAHAA